MPGTNLTVNKRNKFCSHEGYLHGVVGMGEGAGRRDDGGNKLKNKHYFK